MHTRGAQGRARPTEGQQFGPGGSHRLYVIHLNSFHFIVSLFNTCMLRHDQSKVPKEPIHTRHNERDIPFPTQLCQLQQMLLTQLCHYHKRELSEKRWIVLDQ